MKKLFIILAAAALNCGVANAQLDDLLNQAKSAVSNNSTLSSAIATISSKLVPNEKQIIGTWVYQEPAIMLTSNSSLKQLIPDFKEELIPDFDLTKRPEQLTHDEFVKLTNCVEKIIK